MHYIYLAPARFIGDGSYAISDVKQIEVTEDFLGLDDSIKKCQNTEPFEKCTTRHYLDTVREECKCIPYAMKDNNASQVSFYY